MAEINAATAPQPDPRFALRPAELVQALMAGELTLDLGTYPDADTGIYGRISEDRKDKTSVERQLEIGIAYAQRERLPYVVFFDRGKSAYRKGVKRPHYEAALNAVRARRLKRLVAYKLDRVYRQVEELMDIIKIADDGRVPVTLIGVDDDERFDLTTGRGCDQAIGRVLEAQKESRRISERVKTERRKAREMGIPGPGAAAFGWRDKLHHDEKEAEAVRQAYESILHGGSLRAIAMRWTAAGFTTARGSLFGATDVRKVLTNQRNVGRLTHSYQAFDEKGNKLTVTEVVREDAFPQIVDVETFDAVHRILDQRAKPHNHPRRRHMMTRLVRCGQCDGGVMNRNNVNGRMVYRCLNGKGKHVGCGMQVNAQHLHDLVEETLFRYMDSPGYARRVAERRETGSRRAELIEKRDRLAKRRDALSDALLNEEYGDDLDQYRRDVRRFGEQIKGIDDELALFPAVSPAARWAGHGAELRETWKTFDDDEKRAIIEDAFGRITIHKTAKRGKGIDPDRVEFGVDVEAH
jgi:site-specific DNA recombinase